MNTVLLYAHRAQHVILVDDDKQFIMTDNTAKAVIATSINQQSNYLLNQSNIELRHGCIFVQQFPTILIANHLVTNSIFLPRKQIYQLLFHH